MWSQAYYDVTDINNNGRCEGLYKPYQTRSNTSDNISTFTSAVDLYIIKTINMKNSNRYGWYLNNNTNKHNKESVNLEITVLWECNIFTSEHQNNVALHMIGQYDTCDHMSAQYSWNTAYVGIKYQSVKHECTWQGVLNTIVCDKVYQLFVA
jgi:hypothetical protein